MESKEIQNRHKYNCIQHKCDHDENKASYNSRSVRFDGLNDRLDAKHYSKNIDHSHDSCIKKHKHECFAVIKSNAGVHPGTR